ncbi:lanthionine synthetase LanC family protein [Chryseobacterium sp. 3008163]|uniref:lanthionine synthetase LanC family protein n=1 Tax=Chryseobacterium sp. 3008163 TaxID=2478663 RepID=UPI0013EDFA88|nr:lanthionine synthetase LanC family protein [Chryseobacterium sp. 3008163]
MNNKISKEDLQRQLLLIKYNFAQNTTGNSRNIFTKKHISENIKLTYDFFKNLIGKNVTYLTLQESYDLPNQYNFEYSNNDIINGKFGDLLFLAEANKKFNNSYIDKTIFRIYDENIKYLYNSDYLGMAGIGGSIYFLLRMYKIYNDNKFINDALNYINSLDLINIIESSKNNGIIYGRAGLLIALIELEKLTDSLVIHELVQCNYHKLISSAIKCPEGIYWMSEFHDKPLCGVAHGSSGIILALSKYFKQSRNLECKNIIKQAVLFENTFYCDKNKNWKDNRTFISKGQEFSSFGWSHGSPGIGLVRLELIESDIFLSEEFLNILKTDLKNCVESTFKNGLKGKDSLIYGKYGNVELLVRFSSYTNNLEILNEIEGYLNSFNNLYFIKQNKGLIIPGLFNGVSGYGYQLLFFNNYIKNSILTFDCH